MSDIRQIDFLFIDKLVDIGSGPGYVLHFSNRTFAQFFSDELNVDIYDPAYDEGGESKGRRLQYFLKVADNETASRTLEALWEYRNIFLDDASREDTLKNAHGKFLELTKRLRGKKSTNPGVIQPAHNWAAIDDLKSELITLSSLAPHQRGYAFEAFLKNLFDSFGLRAREPFRNRGEQIDGSFDLKNETYLLEAKWQNGQTGAADLHILQGRLENKAAWSRGMFVSYSGFTEDGLYAFGRGKRVICVDGRDIYESLDQQIPFDYVLEQKVRRAAETGEVFVRLADLPKTYEK